MAISIHNDWGRNLQATSKCDWCSKKNTVLRRCNICYINACRACVASGCLEDLQHNVSRTSADDFDWKKYKKPRHSSQGLDTDTTSEVSPSPQPQQPSLEQHGQPVREAQSPYGEYLSRPSFTPPGSFHPCLYHGYYREPMPGPCGLGLGPEQGYLGRGMPPYGAFHPQDPRMQLRMPSYHMGGPPGWVGSPPPAAGTFPVIYVHFGRGFQQEPRYDSEQVCYSQPGADAHHPHSLARAPDQPLATVPAVGRKRGRPENPADESDSEGSEDLPLSFRRKIKNSALHGDAFTSPQPLGTQTRMIRDAQSEQSFAEKTQAENFWPKKIRLTTTPFQKQSSGKKTGVSEVVTDEQESSGKPCEMGAKKPSRNVSTEPAKLTKKEQPTEPSDSQAEEEIETQERPVINLSKDNPAENIPARTRSRDRQAPADVDEDVREAAQILFAMSRSSFGPRKVHSDRADAPSPTTATASRRDSPPAAISRPPVAPAPSPVAFPKAATRAPALSRAQHPVVSDS